MKWQTVKGIATYGEYEVRVTQRLEANARPVRWAVFKVVDGARLRLTPEGQDFKSFADAKKMAERVACVVQTYNRSIS